MKTSERLERCGKPLECDPSNKEVEVEVEVEVEDPPARRALFVQTLQPFGW